MIILNRRRFVAATAMTLGASTFSSINLTKAQRTEIPRSSLTFRIKQVNAELLNVGYAEVGPVNGHPAILLHGWPYDIHSYIDVAPLLMSNGYRVIIPFLRGYGTTHFLSILARYQGGTIFDEGYKKG